MLVKCMCDNPTQIVTKLMISDIKHLLLVLFPETQGHMTYAETAPQMTWNLKDSFPLCYECFLSL